MNILFQYSELQWSEKLTMFNIYMQIIIYTFVCLCWVVGLLGNILSAIVWLRRQVATKNSSAVYLASLAINDTVYLVSVVLLSVLYGVLGYDDYLVLLFGILCDASFALEPLLVLGFSIERLIAIRHPLQVRSL